MTQLKRWLVCQGAPTTGHKPELNLVSIIVINKYYLFDRALCYIKYGWDKLLVARTMVKIVAENLLHLTIQAL